MEKHLAIIEFETHASLLEKWYFLLNGMDGFTFHFFVHDKVGSKLKVIPKQYLTVVNKIDEIPVENYDLVIVNTFHRYFSDYMHVFKTTKHAVVLHNLNFSTFFKSITFSNLFKERNRLLYFVKLYFKENVLTKRKDILNAENVVVLSESLLSCLSSVPLFKKTHFFNLNYCKDFAFKRGEEINIVIPGNISSNRKDLGLVYSVLSQLNPICKLHFVFLGKSENRKVLQKLSNLSSTSNGLIDITFFEGYVPQDIYNSHTENAHLLFCPIKMKTSFYGVTEIYGKTKVSGNENDCIFNGKLGLFPKDYPSFDWLVHQYSNEEELVKYFNSLTFDKLEEAYNKIAVSGRKHTFENQKKILRNQLLELIEQ